MNASRRFLSVTGTGAGVVGARLKDQLLKAALLQVPQYGWTDDALVTGAMNHFDKNNNNNNSSSSSSGVSLAVSGMITVQDLLTHSMSQWNEQLREDLTSKVTNDKSLQVSPNAVPIIITAVQIRLSYVKDLIKSGRWHEGMAVGIQPTQISTTQQQLQELIEIICQQIPDETFSMTEQFTLGAIYVATELHMLRDTSDDYKDTWQFLTDRVTDWDNIRKQQLQNVPFGSLFPSSPIPIPDFLYTFSHVATSLASGVVSIVHPSASSAPFIPPIDQWSPSSEIYKKPPFDGTDPSHYEPTSTPSK
jgi:rpsU-divergently transcribed protein